MGGDGTSLTAAAKSDFLGILGASLAPFGGGVALLNLSGDLDLDFEERDPSKNPVRAES